jgi:hypothetical protein
MKDIIINTMSKGDGGHWTATGTLEGNGFEAKTIKYGNELIFKVVEGGDIAKSLTDSEFGRGERVSIAAACKAVRTMLEEQGSDELASPTKPGKQSKAAGSSKPRAKKEPKAIAKTTDAPVEAVIDAEATRREIEAIRALLASTAEEPTDLAEYEAGEDAGEDAEEN